MVKLQRTLLQLHYEGLVDVDVKEVFLNFEVLYVRSLQFWNDGILPMLKHSRDSGDMLDLMCLEMVFFNIVEWSECYIHFNLRPENARIYISKMCEKNENFHDFIKVSCFENFL